MTTISEFSAVQKQHGLTNTFILTADFAKNRNVISPHRAVEMRCFTKARADARAKTSTMGTSGGRTT